jgi:serine/threonine-protein kinase
VIGETVGNFKIVSKLSVGGMGTVYKAEHTLIGKLAAVKVLHEELTTSRDIVQRFFNEAKATTQIKHPGIVEIFDYGLMSSGAAYLTMEFLDGMSLARRMKTRGAMSEGEAAMLLRAVCSALHAAHAKGIIHRDLKPDNIFLTPDPDSATGERPKLLDFGIAKLTDVGLAGTATKTGAVMGTPTYMSPEQCRGTGEVDARADLYSIGCIFYELVTGHPPFTNLGAGELIGAHLFVEPEPPSGNLHPETVKLIMALLRKRAAERPQTAKELGSRLTELAQKLGWITAASPNGVTGPELADVAMRAQTAGEHARDSQLAVAQTMFTPGGSAAPSLASLERSLDDAEAPAETPTTLSGAASQVDLQRRSRKGLGIAMAAAAFIAGGTVTFLKVRQNKQRETATQPAPAPVAAPTPVAAPEPAPTPPVAAPPTEVQPAPVETPVVTEAAPLDPASAKKDPVKVEHKRQQERRRVTVKKHPPKTETEPKKPTLIETDIE